MFRNAKVLIEQMDGGFDEMNRFVRETICRALARSHEQYELTFQGAMRVKWNPKHPIVKQDFSPQNCVWGSCF